MAQGNVRELYGLIGHPVKHSFSAFMHQAAFAHYGMDAVYELFDVPPEDLEIFFKSVVPAKKIKGFNVTVPHKERACQFLTGSVSPGVRINRAVNTVRVESDGTLTGFNTDGPGFGRDLKERGVDVAGKKVVLMGAGGGAKSVATALAAQGMAAIVIFDVDAAKVLSLSQILRENFPAIKVVGLDAGEKMELFDAALLVNATPVGMKSTDPLLVSPQQFHRGLFVYDLIYNPLETKLITAARAAGCDAANGLGMLLYQGCLAFEHWTGKAAPVEIMRRALGDKIHG